MIDLYYVGVVNHKSDFGSDQMAFVKADHMIPGSVVEFRIRETSHLGKVISTSLISKGSDDEAELYANTKVYDAEAVYHRCWVKEPEKEEEENA